MGQRPPSSAPGAPAALTGLLAPIVSVRDIQPIDGHLWAVTIRTQTGQVLTLVIDRQLATTGTVAMAAHVVASLAVRNRIPTQPKKG